MRVLVVCSGNAQGFEFRRHQSFVYEQIEAVCRRFEGVTYDTYFFTGKGIIGYSKNLGKLRRKIADFRPDVLHAHGGHVGAFCSMQRLVPVVTTFHGSDLNRVPPRIVSLVAYLFSAATIFVSERLKKRLWFALGKSWMIPCGVDFNTFCEQDKSKVKRFLGILETEKYILFSSSFNNQVKNFPLAENAVSDFPGINIREINGRSREEVSALMNGAELLLMTSIREGSPQVIKEAMACNLPIVSVNVGDVKDVLGETEGTFLTSYDALDVADKVGKALEFGKRTNGRARIKHLDNDIIATSVYGVYCQIVAEKGTSLRKRSK